MSWFYGSKGNSATRDFPARVVGKGDGVSPPCPSCSGLSQKEEEKETFELLVCIVEAINEGLKERLFELHPMCSQLLTRLEEDEGTDPYKCPYTVPIYARILVIMLITVVIILLLPDLGLELRLPHLRFTVRFRMEGFVLHYLPIVLGGAKELGIVYINIIRGAKEPGNLQNHRGVIEQRFPTVL